MDSENREDLESLSSAVHDLFGKLDEEHKKRETNIDAVNVYGEGVKAWNSKDFEKALELFKESADLGYSGTANFAGFMYKHGIGTEKDLAEAKVWKDKADATDVNFT